MRMKKSALLLMTFFCFLLINCSKDNEQQVQGFIEGQFIYLSSSVSGDLDELLVYRGDSIKIGEKLFVLDPNPQKAELVQAKNELKAAQDNLNNLIQGNRLTILQGIEAQISQNHALLKFAKQTLIRNQYLYKQGTIGKAQLDEAESNYQNALEKVNQLKADLAEAKLGAREHLIAEQESRVAAEKEKVAKFEWQLSQKTMYSPFNARVYDTFFKEGEFVPAGRSVLAILAPKDIKLIFYIPEPQLSQLKLGDSVEFDCDGCAGRTTAIIDYISPQAEYTPPVLYSRESRQKLVYRIEAAIAPQLAVNFNAGQPVNVYLSLSKNNTK